MLDLVALSLRASANCESCSLQLVKSSCAYYHYLCDKMDDRGWGCGYRSLQSLCSWADGKRGPNENHRLPSLRQIQDILVEIGDKPPSFASSNNWIGCFEACIVLDHVYEISSKLIHVPSGCEIRSHVPALFEHFKVSGAPVMIGGDLDAASKTLIGIRLGTCLKHEEVEFLIADPHLVEAGTTAGSVALSAEERKLDNNDQKCCELNWICVPMAVEAYGAWGQEA